MTRSHLIGGKKRQQRTFKKKNGHKALIAEESDNKWVESDSDESTSRSSSRESEEDEIQCLMADDSDEAFDKCMDKASKMSIADTFITI
ncbi:hypothetical protein F511_18521 [Dorcoceras hygrometricum]|uniref:Uncharacterized protein n=1 Tax=Dorcoceras hygrometricum TaxID=472368 RepID=A0A2Z7B6C5_9LAMI|nr:hypothetical protein F511_18521 [Dorcoceras hygrometricum]